MLWPTSKFVKCRCDSSRVLVVLTCPAIAAVPTRDPVKRLMRCLFQEDQLRNLRLITMHKVRLLDNQPNLQFTMAIMQAIILISPRPRTRQHGSSSYNLTRIKLFAVVKPQRLLGGIFVIRIPHWKKLSDSLQQSTRSVILDHKRISQKAFF